MMAFPNLIAVLCLSPVVFKLTRDYFAEETEAEKVAARKLD
jgi:AGCS family alanine or glycine:cation symporter